MDAELKSKWVAALRSGEYKQGTDMLRTDDNCYCCLGVLCDIGGRGKWEWKGYGRWFYEVGDESDSGELPDCLQMEYGGKAGLWGELMEMNDDGTPFHEIADYIEANV